MASPAVLPAGRRSHFDALIVGAGFAGSDHRRAAGRGLQQNACCWSTGAPHVGGNAFDLHDEAGGAGSTSTVRTSSTPTQTRSCATVALHRWRTYEHRVLAQRGRQAGPDPDQPYDAEHALQTEPDHRRTGGGLPGLSRRAGRPDPNIGRRGDFGCRRELYEKFFQGYTRKQWGIDPSGLDRSVTSRVPTRTNIDDRYFNDSFQACRASATPYVREHVGPREHHHRDGDRICRRQGPGAVRRLVFTGPVDEFFGHRYGKLPYRSLKFRHETLDQEEFQPVAVVNYPRPDVPYTRISEYKHLTARSTPRPRSPTSIPAPKAIPTTRSQCAGSGAIQALRGAGVAASGRGLRRPTRHLPLLQHGPGGRPGARDLQEGAGAVGGRCAPRATWAPR